MSVHKAITCFVTLLLHVTQLAMTSMDIVKFHIPGQVKAHGLFDIKGTSTSFNTCYHNASPCKHSKLLLLLLQVNDPHSSKETAPSPSRLSLTSTQHLTYFDYSTEVRRGGGLSLRSLTAGGGALFDAGELEEFQDLLP